MFEKILPGTDPVITPMGVCLQSQCKKGCNGGAGNSSASVERDNTPEDPSGE